MNVYKKQIDSQSSREWRRLDQENAETPEYDLSGPLFDLPGTSLI